MAPCPHCACTDLMTVTLEPDGQPMRLRICRGCEHRWWTHQVAGDIVLEDVLSAVAET